MTPPAWTNTPAANAPTVADAQDAFHRALEARVAVHIKDTYGEPVLNEYLAVREKDDLAETLLFEARQGLNIDQIFQEQEAAIKAEMEQKLPGSAASIFGAPPATTDNQSTN